MGSAIIPPNSPLIDKRGNMTTEWYRFFASLDRLSGGGVIDRIVGAPFLTFAATGDLPANRVLAGGAGLTLAIGGTLATMSITDTAVVPGAYGTATKTVALTVNSQGRVTAAQQFDLNTDNIAQGVANLFYADALARAAVSAGDGLDYDNTTGEFSLDTASARNVDHGAVEIKAGTGLTGGGYTTASRTLSLADTAVAPGIYGDASHSARVTIDQQGRVTDASSVAITVASIIGDTPAADGTYTNPTSITIKNGVITAIS